MPGTRLYGDLASYYDLLCAHIDYAEQAATARRLHQLFGQGGSRYLDLACGTGPLVEQFTAYGYDATGLDLNPAMLQLARARCPAAEFSLQDMSAFQFEQRFDLITCLLYSLHYCYPKTHFLTALENVFISLNPGGVFCFDAVDKNTIANDEGSIHYVQQGEAAIRFQSRWHYSGVGDRLDLHLSASETSGDPAAQWRDQHTMLALDLATLQRDLAGLGFEVTMLERDFTKLSPWNGRHGNVLVVGVKP